jgi:glyoxylase-like metal-dependent hydrolase (beta-lactamase superfamily II)
MCFALPKTGDLFTGDHVMGWSTSVVIPPYGNMSDYINSLEKLLTRSDHCYWPTHGPPIGDPKIFVKSLIAHRLKRIKDIVALLEIGPLSISEMVEPLYTQIDPRLIGAASRSIFASLIYLIDKKIIACDSAVSLQSIFRTIER